MHQATEPSDKKGGRAEDVRIRLGIRIWYAVSSAYGNSRHPTLPSSRRQLFRFSVIHELVRGPGTAQAQPNAFRRPSTAECRNEPLRDRRAEPARATRASDGLAVTANRARYQQSPPSAWRRWRPCAILIPGAASGTLAHSRGSQGQSFFVSPSGSQLVFDRIRQPVASVPS